MTSVFFLAVMMLIIGLHSPVFGYCEESGEVFFGGHLVEESGDECHDSCEHEEEPCDEEHDFLTVETDDFQWNPLLVASPPLALIVEELDPVRPLFLSSGWGISTGVFASLPPPPGIPIFRRDGVLRL